MTTRDEAMLSTARPGPWDAGGGAQRGALPERADLGWSQPPGLVGLSFKNFLLRILTLGIYGFWGKTEVRNRIWSAIRLNGEPLQYTGTGKELFIGFLMIFAAVLLPTLLASIVATVVFGPKSPALALFQLCLYLVFFYLIGVGIHRAQRYRLSRTRWRGIRGGLDGSSSSYAWTYFWTGVLMVPTLGWIGPWRSTRLQGLIFNHMRFGNRPFAFAASSAPLYGRFAIMWFGGIVILVATVALIASSMAVLGPLPGSGVPIPANKVAAIVAIVYGGLFVGGLLYGILSSWYSAGMMNHFARSTTFEGARFAGTATAGSLIWLNISNLLLTVLSLGVLAPVGQVRSARYFIERLTIEGEVPLGAIAQSAALGPRHGEGLAQAFDVDAF